MSDAKQLGVFCAGCGTLLMGEAPRFDQGDGWVACAECQFGDDDMPLDGPEPQPVAAPRLALLCTAGMVRRWHMNPALAATNQTDADHTGRCLQLLLALNPGASPALARWLVFHDVGELGAGDLSGPMKTARPRLASHHAMFETEVRVSICGPDPVLSPIEARWAAFIDRLEAAAWVLMTRPWEFTRKTSGWDMVKISLIATANDLGCGAQVMGLLDDLQGGVW